MASLIKHGGLYKLIKVQIAPSRYELFFGQDFILILRVNSSYRALNVITLSKYHHFRKL